MEEFLEGLSRKQLIELQDILNFEIDGNIKYFLCKLDQELAIRNKPIKHWSDEIN